MAEQWEQLNSKSGEYEEIENWGYRDEGKGAELIGELIEIKHNVGQDNKTIWIFKRKDGEKRQIWGGVMVLDDNLGKLQVGDSAKIVYNGKVQSKSNKSQNFHSFNIYAKRGKNNTKTNDTGQEVDPEDIPF